MSGKKKSRTEKKSKLTYNIKDLQLLARNEKLALWSKEDLVRSLNKIFLADQWLDLEQFTTEKTAEIFTRLVLESEHYTLTAYNDFVAGDAEKEKSKFYGSNFPRLSVANIEALKICHEKKGAKFLDLGSGWGAVTWKALLAGCKVTAVDILFDREKFKAGFTKNIADIVPAEIYNQNLETISSSAADLLQLHPEYEGKFDVVHSARVLHFHVPKYFGAFASTVSSSLKPTGKAIIITDSIFGALSGLPSYCAGYYEEHKKYGSIVPGYMLVSNVMPKNNVGNIKIAACYMHRDEKELLALEVMPPHEYQLFTKSSIYTSEVGRMVGKGSTVDTYMLATFDIDSLKQVFQDENLQVLDSYYFGGKDSTKEMLVTKHSEGGEGVAVVLEKIGSSIDIVEDL